MSGAAHASDVPGHCNLAPRPPGPRSVAAAVAAIVMIGPTRAYGQQPNTLRPAAAATDPPITLEPTPAPTVAPMTAALTSTFSNGVALSWQTSAPTPIPTTSEPTTSEPTARTSRADQDDDQYDDDGPDDYDQFDDEPDDTLPSDMDSGMPSGFAMQGTDAASLELEGLSDWLWVGDCSLIVLAANETSIDIDTASAAPWRYIYIYISARKTLRVPPM